MPPLSRRPPTNQYAEREHARLENQRKIDPVSSFLPRFCRHGAQFHGHYIIVWNTALNPRSPVSNVGGFRVWTAIDSDAVQVLLEKNVSSTTEGKTTLTVHSLHPTSLTLRPPRKKLQENKPQNILKSKNVRASPSADTQERRIGYLPLPDTWRLYSFPTTTGGSMCTIFWRFQPSPFFSRCWRQKRLLIFQKRRRIVWQFMLYILLLHLATAVQKKRAHAGRKRCSQCHSLLGLRPVPMTQVINYKTMPFRNGSETKERRELRQRSG